MARPRVRVVVRPARRLHDQEIALPRWRVFVRSATVHKSARLRADGRKLHALLRIGLAE